MKNSDFFAKLFCDKYNPYSNGRVYLLFKEMFSGNEKAKRKLKILKNRIIEEWKSEKDKLFDFNNTSISIVINTSFSRSHKSKNLTAQISFKENDKTEQIEFNISSPKEDNENYKYQSPARVFEGTLEEYKNSKYFDSYLIIRLTMFIENNNRKLLYFSNKLNSKF